MKHFKNMMLIVLLTFMLTMGCTFTKSIYYTINLHNGDIVETIKERVNETTLLPVLNESGMIFGGWFKDIDYLDGPYESYFSEEKVTINFYAYWEIKEKPDYEAAGIIINLINDLPKALTIENEDEINDINNAYLELNESTRALVINYQVLVDAFEVINSQKDLIFVLIDLIDSLPTIITLDDKDTLELAREEYNNLPDILQGYITNYNALVAKEEEYLGLFEGDTKIITYVLGNNIYRSKNEFFVSFFTDFYNFIDYQYGKEVLNPSGIYNVQDFLNLASDMNGGGTDNMRGIGNIAGSYLLTKDLNGILADQPIDKFIGYCYQNDLYVDILPFFVRFFAYWRLDERYANTSNYGADFFAESWAPTVDIGKFFYYDEPLSFMKTERMIDYFANIAGVVYGDLPTELSTTPLILPSNLQLRGYIFAGWYDNPDFTGQAITSATQGDRKITLYAKWEIDNVIQDKDSAALVDIYIYNLTTTKADLNKVNVQKVRTMYNALSPNAKLLVSSYSTLLAFENLFNGELNGNKIITINIEKPYYFTSFETMKSEFLVDFNEVTSSNVSQYKEFTQNRYTLMNKLTTFFLNDAMFTKWSFLAQYFLNADKPANGLSIQSKRLLSQTSGELEYVSKAIDGFFSQSNLKQDTEVGIDFSNASLVCSNLDDQRIINITYSSISTLPQLVIAGYDFLGYFDSLDDLNNSYIEVNNDTPSILYAIFAIK